MTTLATLAQGAHTAAPTFNSDFYTTIAAAIPVLLLAFAVQSPNAWQKMLQTAIHFTSVTRNIPNPRLNTSLIPSRLTRPAMYLSWFMVTIALLIVAVALVGEVLAINALYDQSASSLTSSFVLAAALALTVVAVTVPIIQGSTALMWTEAEIAQPVGIPGSPTQPEPGKTNLA
jgi:hypothetical protein